MTAKREFANALADYNKNLFRWCGVVIGTKEDKKWIARLDDEKAAIQHMAAELGIELEFGEPPNYPALINHVMRKHSGRAEGTEG